MRDLLEQVPAPMILLGDFNAHNQLWGKEKRAQEGENLQQIQPHVPKQKRRNLLQNIRWHKSTKDLTLTPEYKQSKKYELRGSNHFPIIIEDEREVSTKQNQSWSTLDTISERKKNYNKNVGPKNNRRSTQLPSQNSITNRENHPNNFPRDEEKTTSSIVEQRIVRAEYRKHHRDQTKTTKLRLFQCRRVIKQSFKESQNSLNPRTPTKKVQDKFRKVNRNYKPRTIPPLERGETIITSPAEVADTFADHYANILRDSYKKRKPVKNRKKK